MENIIRIFPTSIGLYECKKKNYDSECNSLIDLYLQEQNKSSNINVSQFLQTPTGLHRNKLFASISQFVTDCVFNYINECGFDVEKNELYIADSWANISSGIVTTHTPHTHSNSFISAVFFASAPKGSGSLYFMHPNMAVNTIDPDHKHQTVDNTTEVAFDPEPGMCVVFKSSTIHGTSYNMLNNGQYRVSLAYNFNVKNLGKNSLFSHYEGQ